VGLLDALGYIGDSFDKLGSRELRGLLGGRPRELLSIIPFSDAIGVTNPEQRVSGRDITNNTGITRKGDPSFKASALGFGAEALLDPTLLLGGAGLLRKGFKSTATKVLAHPASPKSNMLFRPAAESADQSTIRLLEAAGPQHEGGIRQLEDILRGGGPESPGFGTAQRILSEPGSLLHRLAQEFPEGSTHLGSGMEAIVAKRPDKGVIRIAPSVSPIFGRGRQFVRPNIPEMLQPVRSVDIGPYRVEHMPEVFPFMKGKPDVDAVARMLGGHEPGAEVARTLYDEMTRQAGKVAGSLSESVERRGLRPVDVHSQNVARTLEDLAIIHDGGSIIHQKYGRRLAPTPAIADLSGVSQDALGRLSGSGGAEEVRRAISRGLEQGTKGQGIKPPINLQDFASSRRLFEHITNHAPYTIGATTRGAMDHRALLNALEGSSTPRRTHVSFAGTSHKPSLLRSILTGAWDSVRGHRIPLGVGALGTAELTRLQSALHHQQ
jgi:hypothetical protein